jgi:hypothetical protein
VTVDGTNVLAYTADAQANDDRRVRASRYHPSRR